MGTYHKLVWTLGAMLAILPAATAPARAQSYAITELGTLPSGDTYVPLGINPAGQAVGVAGVFGMDGVSETNHAVLFGATPLTDLGTLGGDSSQAEGINAAGQIVGEAAVAGDALHAFVYAQGTMTDLGTLDGDTGSEAVGINVQGQIAGISYADQGMMHGFVYANGAMAQIGPLPGGTYTYVVGISDSGQITGWADNASGDDHAFLYSSGAMQDLGTLPGGSFSLAAAINATNQVVGAADAADGTTHAFLYAGGTMTALPTLLNATYSDAVAINARGEVVGHCDDGTGMGNNVPVLYEHGRVVNLNAALPPGSGWTLESVSGINDSGQIIGTGGDPQGNKRAFLLTPVPQTRFDFDGDGGNDLLWHNTATGQTLVWNMNDLLVTHTGSPFATVSNTDWTVAATADVNGDGTPDLLWENTRTGQVLFWLMGGPGGTTVLSYGSPFATVSDTHWHVVSMADADGDGRADILWQNSATGQLCVWLMNGATVAKYGAPVATGVTDPHWQVVGTADFDGDGQPDLLWENSQTGQLAVWYMGATTSMPVLRYGSPFATVSDTHWHVVGTGDMDGDGQPDLVWQNTQTGQLVRWRMGGADGTQVLENGSPFATVSDTHWQIVGVH